MSGEATRKRRRWQDVRLPHRYSDRILTALADHKWVLVRYHSMEGLWAHPATIIDAEPEPASVFARLDAHTKPEPLSSSGDRLFRACIGSTRIFAMSVVQGARSEEVGYRLALSYITEEWSPAVERPVAASAPPSPPPAPEVQWELGRESLRAALADAIVSTLGDDHQAIAQQLARAELAPVARLVRDGMLGRSSAQLEIYADIASGTDCEWEVRLVRLRRDGDTEADHA